MKDSLKEKFLKGLALPAFSASVIAAAGTGLIFAEDLPETETVRTEAAAETEGLTEPDTEAEDLVSGGGIRADDWLPIGSVVLIKGYDRNFMVLGRALQNESDGRHYDYCACLCPDGYMGGELYFFNQEDIEEVLFRGFEDEYEQLLRLEELDGLDTASLSSGETKAESEGQSEAGEAGGEAAGTAESGQESGEAAEPETAEEGAGSGESDAETAEPGDGAAASGAETAESGTELSESESPAAEDGQTRTVTENVRLRSQPGTGSQSLVTIPGGRQVEIDGSRQAKGDWVPVIFKDSAGKELAGWVKKEFLADQ